MLSNKNTVSTAASAGEIVKQSTLKKLNTMKKKYFVLRGDSGSDSTSSPQLEYYENEKKFKQNSPPKRVIKLKNCFNINRLVDKKQKYVIGLYSRVGLFGIVFETEDEMNDWLESLLKLQHGQDNLAEGEPVKPIFEHVWKVEVMERDMGSRIGILGPYHVCLTNQLVSLIKVTTDESSSSLDFSLEKVRACGNMNTFFYMQVGNDTPTGAGSLWMTTGDAAIAESMHNTIMKACARCHGDRTRVDGPHTRIRTNTNESNDSIASARYNQHTGDVANPVRNVALSLRPSERRHSVAAGSNTVSSGVICHQRTYSFPLSDTPTSIHPSTITMHHHHSLSQVKDKVDGSSTTVASSVIPCSRPRTTSEGNHLLCRTTRPYSIYNKSSPSNSVTLLSPSSCGTDSASSMDSDWEESQKHTIFHVPHTPEMTGSILEEPASSTEDLILHDPHQTSVWQSQAEDEKLNNYMVMSVVKERKTSLGTPHAHLAHHSQIFTSHKSSSPSQGSLIFADSSYNSSPMDTAGYMPMSPVDGRAVNHSRGSSIDDYNTNILHHNHSDDGYVDMGPKSRDRYQSGGNTSGGSSCSLTSGTTSFDIMKLSEYSLDRVSSGIGPEELRPTRAYSVGSRPHTNNNNKSESHSSGGEEKRVRAFSFGSHQQHTSRLIAGLGRLTGMGRPNTGALLDEPDDLMEMDFTKRAKNNKNMRVANKKPSSIERLTDTSISLSPPKTNRLAALFGRSPPKPSVISPPNHTSPCLDRVPEAEPGYLDMSVPHVSPSVNIKPQNILITSHRPSSGGQPLIKPALFSNKTTDSSSSYVDMNLKRKTSGGSNLLNNLVREDNNNSKIIHNNGYVEMKPSDNTNSQEEPNYMNMSGSNVNTKAEKRHNRKDRRFSSQPIKIQAREVPRQPLLCTSVSSNGSTGSVDRMCEHSEICGRLSGSDHGSLESKVFVTMKSPCNACDYVMFQPPTTHSSQGDDISDYTMMGPPDRIDLVKTRQADVNSGLCSMSLSDSEIGTQDDLSSRSSSIHSFHEAEKEVEYASLDLRRGSEDNAVHNNSFSVQSNSYASIVFPPASSLHTTSTE